MPAASRRGADASPVRSTPTSQPRFGVCSVDVPSRRTPRNTGKSADHPPSPLGAATRSRLQHGWRYLLANPSTAENLAVQSVRALYPRPTTSTTLSFLIRSILLKLLRHLAVTSTILLVLDLCHHSRWALAPSTIAAKSSAASPGSTHHSQFDTLGLLCTPVSLERERERDPTLRAGGTVFVGTNGSPSRAYTSPVLVLLKSSSPHIESSGGKEPELTKLVSPNRLRQSLYMGASLI